VIRVIGEHLDAYDNSVSADASTFHTALGHGSNAAAITSSSSSSAVSKSRTESIPARYGGRPTIPRALQGGTSRERQSDFDSREADLDDNTAQLSTDRIHVEAMQAAEELDEQRTEIRAVQDTLRTTQSAQDSRVATLVDKQRELEDSDSALLR